MIKVFKVPALACRCEEEGKKERKTERKCELDVVVVGVVKYRKKDDTKGDEL